MVKLSAAASLLGRFAANHQEYLPGTRPRAIQQGSRSMLSAAHRRDGHAGANQSPAAESSPDVSKTVNKRPTGEFFYGASTNGRATPKNAFFALKCLAFRIASEEVILKA